MGKKTSKFQGKSEQVADLMLKNFETGDIPKALAQVFVKRNDTIPSAQWSWRNRLIMALSGTFDARGYKAWQKVGRAVQGGQKAIYILAPCFGKKKNDAGEIETFIYGFKSIAVFAIESTDIVDEELWKESNSGDATEMARLAELPLIEVAAAWGIDVTSYSGKTNASLGWYSHGKEISLGTENLSTWMHELVHAADDQNGTLVKGLGQDQSNEIVAEFGGAILLHMMGYEVEADQGGAWNYIMAYSKNDKSKAMSACGKLIDRMCKAVDLIIETKTTKDGD
jgi:hypothetical protein